MFVFREFKISKLPKVFYFDTQVGGGKINWPGQLAPPPPSAKRTEQCDNKTAKIDSNYVYN